MYLIGWRTIWRTTDQGLFQCPAEGRDRPYRVRRARRFLHVLLVPLVPIKRLGDVVECKGCDTRFEPNVLDRPSVVRRPDPLLDAVRCSVIAITELNGGSTQAERTEAVTVIGGYAPSYGPDEFETDLRALATYDLDKRLRAAVDGLAPSGRERLFEECVRVAAADGRITREEHELLLRIGSGLLLSHAHVAGALLGSSAVRSVDGSGADSTRR